MNNYGLLLVEAGLDLTSAPYDVQKETFGKRAVTWRRSEVSNRWVEGSFVTSAVRDNTREQLSIWVEGELWSDVDTALQALEAAISALTWTLDFTVDDLTTTFSCQVADYAITASQEFRASGAALLEAQVPCLPTTTRTIT